MTSAVSTPSYLPGDSLARGLFVEIQQLPDGILSPNFPVRSDE